jgi:hypothetical protein
MSKTLSLVCVLGLTLAALTFDAQAMPTTSVGARVHQDGLIIQAQGRWRGCPRGWHRSWRWPHRCIPNWRRW